MFVRTKIISYHISYENLAKRLDLTDKDIQKFELIHGGKNM